MSDASGSTGDAGQQTGQSADPGQQTGNPPPPPPPPPPPGDTTDWKKEYEKAQATIEQTRTAARRAEERAKTSSSAARELETLRRQTMSEQERLVAEARDQARSEALREVAQERVSAKLAQFAAGRLDPGAVARITSVVTADAFLNDDGSINEKAIQEFVDGIAPKAPANPPDPRFPDLSGGQGSRQPDQALNGSGLEAALRAAVGIQ
jgi:type IV secretory pathway VirB10-like protein